MKKIDLKGLDISYYFDSLSNGLEIYLLPDNNKKNYFITFATRFGSDILEFTDQEKKTHKPPLGVAHFLEHKMFEQEDGIDPFTFFSNSGTDANAATSFDSTQYICMGTKNFNTNLRYLLQFVMSPYYTDENVEKEKGIIAEEIKMYDDMPDFKLEMTLREGIYKNSPRRIDIAGTVNEIMKITKEDLYDCYSNYYIPNNMFVLIVGNFNENEALGIIRDELRNKANHQMPKSSKIKEPASINIKEQTIKSNIEVPKIGFGLKVPTENIKLSNIELDLYLHMLTTMLFGPSSEFRERVRNERIMSGIYTEWESIPEYKTFYLMASTIDPDKLLNEIKEEFINLNINESTFKRIKKVWIANEVKVFDGVESTVGYLYDDIIKYKKVIPNKISMIKKMKFSTLNEIIKEINFSNFSTVTMLSNNNE